MGRLFPRLAKSRVSWNDAGFSALLFSADAVLGTLSRAARADGANNDRPIRSTSAVPAAADRSGESAFSPSASASLGFESRRRLRNARPTPRTDSRINKNKLRKGRSRSRWSAYVSQESARE